MAAAPERSTRHTLLTAIRDAAQFDRGLVSLRAGFLAAVPVAGVLGGGIAAGSPVTGVTMGAGAMLVGIAWRISGGRPPLGVMAADTSLMATSTFAGSATGAVPWLHVVVLCLWAMMAGLLVGVGNRGGVIGTQAVIAVVVFGRFSQPVPAALGLAGLVLAGGLAQVLFLFLVRWPTPLRGQRRATASAYRALAELANATDYRGSLAIGTALDQAEDTLAAPSLFGDPNVMNLRGLVAEGYRLRVQLTALHALLGYGGQSPGIAVADAPVLRRARGLAGHTLYLAAQAIEGDAEAAAPLSAAAAEFQGLIADTELTRQLSAQRTDLAPPVARRLSALGGALRAVAALAGASAGGTSLLSRRPYGTFARATGRWRDYLDQFRASATPHSPAGRHAIRLAVVVPVAEVLARVLPLQRSYWMVVAAATILRPEFTATFTRGTERAVGTALGVALAGAIAVGLHPAGGVIVLLVLALAWLGYSVFPASFAVGFAFITALVVFLLNAVSPDTLATALARLIDTLVGGALGLAVYAAWPTWARTSARQGLADLLGAQRAYLRAVLGAFIVGRSESKPEQDLGGLARRARLARNRAEEVVGRSLSEPSTRRIDARQSQAALGTMRRLVQAAHILRLEIEEARGPREPQPGLAALAQAIDNQLALVQERLGREPDTGAAAPELEELRSLYEGFVATAGDDVVLLTELDELVDAANTLAVTVGFSAVDAIGADEPRPVPRSGS
jgi:uncharacterized membrane protein YccC